MLGLGPIYDPDDAEKLIEIYLAHGDLMGWGGNKQSSSEQDEEDCGEEARDDD